MPSDDPHDEFAYHRQQYFCSKCGEKSEGCRCDLRLPEGTAAIAVLMLSVALAAILALYLL